MPIDPCFAELLADPRNTVRPPPAHVSMDRVRRAADGAMAQGDAPPMATVRDSAVALPGREVPCRVYRPVQVPVLPAVLFCHGGGFVWGSLETHDGICRRLAARTGAAVISVGYRLAPETRFPGPVEDAFGVLQDMISRADHYGIDAGNIALCGDSAGGAICVSIAKRAARDDIALRHLALIYPALDPECDTASQRELADGPLLTREAMRWFWSCYLGSRPDYSDDLLPLQDAGLGTLPATTVATAEFDPLRDEGEILADRLTACGIDVSHRCYPGMIHGFMSLAATSEIIDAALRDVSERIRASFERPGSTG